MVITARAETATASTAAAGSRMDPSVLDQIEASQDQLDALAATLTARLDELHGLQDTFESAVKKQAKMVKAISPPVRAQSAPTRTTRDAPSTNEASSHSSTSAVLSSSASQPAFDDSSLSLRHTNLAERLRQSQRLMPSAGGLFVQLFLGSINVRFHRKTERLAFKSEYERLKLKCAPVFVVFCIVCLLFPDNRWLHMILQLALSWYYVTLAIRENILKANDSNIRTWWIVHHYFTMMQGVLLLTWPSGASYVRFRNRLHAFGLYNAILMIFQTRYQMARLYTLRSLGMANEMDVASSDNTQIHWSETMTLLLPLILLGQLMQGFQAISLFNIYQDFTNELQILLLAVLFLANFIGNLSTTIQVLAAKRSTNLKRAQERHTGSVN